MNLFLKFKVKDIKRNKINFKAPLALVVITWGLRLMWLARVSVFGKILCGCGSRAERHELWPVSLYTCSVSWPCFHGNWLLDCRNISDRGPRAGIDLGIAVFCLFVFLLFLFLFLSVCAHMFLFGDQRLMFSRTLYLIF